MELRSNHPLAYGSAALPHSSGGAPGSALPPVPSAQEPSGEGDALRESFQQFVGQTLFGQMLSSMRKTVDQPAYMHGGQTEKIFQQQLDQIMVEDITEASADTIADPMFELFTLRRAG